MGDLFIHPEGKPYGSVEFLDFVALSIARGWWWDVRVLVREGVNAMTQRFSEFNININCYWVHFRGLIIFVDFIALLYRVTLFNFLLNGLFVMTMMQPLAHYSACCGFALSLRLKLAAFCSTMVASRAKYARATDGSIRKPRSKKYVRTSQ